jgi:hypothetical protein
VVSPVYCIYPAVFLAIVKRTICKLNGTVSQKKRQAQKRAELSYLLSQPVFDPWLAELRLGLMHASFGGFNSVQVSRDNVPLRILLIFKTITSNNDDPLLGNFNQNYQHLEKFFSISFLSFNIVI